MKFEYFVFSVYFRKGRMKASSLKHVAEFLSHADMLLASYPAMHECTKEVINNKALNFVQGFVRNS